MAREEVKIKTHRSCYRSFFLTHQRVNTSSERLVKVRLYISTQLTRRFLYRAVNCPQNDRISYGNYHRKIRDVYRRRLIYPVKIYWSKIHDAF